MANLLRLCGLNLGAESELVAPAPDNPDGYWEHRGFLHVNDEILSQLGGGWDLPPPTAKGSQANPSLASPRAKALELIGSFNGSDTWGWKDPRNSLTFAFWYELLSDLKAVICVRNPLEVASSLRKRGLSSYAFGLQLWKTYNDRLLATTNGDKRIVTHYAAYFQDATAEITRVCDFLGLNASNHALRACHEAIKAGFRHSAFTFHQLEELDAPADIVGLYDRLCADAGYSDRQERPLRANGGVLPQETALLRRRLRQFGVAATDRNRLRDSRRRRLRRLRRKLVELRNERDALEQMVSARRNGHGGALQSGARPPMTKAAYGRLVRRVRKFVMEHVPERATIAVVSKGAEDIVRFSRRTGWHFPQDEQHRFAGYYPSCGLAAIAHLEALRARGAEYLVIPDFSSWWLDTYPEFNAHLATNYRMLAQRPQVGSLYCLSAPAAKDGTPGAPFVEIVARFRAAFGRDPSVLDWASGCNLSKDHPDLPICEPPSAGDFLPYIDKSVDFVAVASRCDAVVSEATRVATTAVIDFASGNNSMSRPTVCWLQDVSPRPLPTVSIIIPVFNQWKHTEACIRAVQETLPPEFRGAIVVVDDASTDETPERMAEVAARNTRVRALRNDVNRGFVDTCNRGAEAAEGEFLIFLNNDTVPLPGWLRPLLQTFEQFPDAGAVGGKLLFPDGRLQEAGGIMFRDASATHFGRGDFDANSLLFNYVRDVDYCSGALLATPRALFRELGGFDVSYRPGYYEDVDYCFRLRTSGCLVYYQPESAVIHMEGVTSGDNLSRGMKRYQVMNRDRFFDRWRTVLEADHRERPAHFDQESWYALAHRGKGTRTP